MCIHSPALIDDSNTFGSSTTACVKRVMLKQILVTWVPSTWVGDRIVWHSLMCQSWKPWV